MSNSLLTSSMIAQEALMRFKNSLGFTGGANRQYDGQFAKKGAKIGATINVRKPQRFTTTDGEVLVLQDVSNDTLPLTLNNRKHVGFQFSTQDLTLAIDDFADLYLQGAVDSLANTVDITGLTLARTVANAVGVPGTAPASTDPISDAIQILNEMATPVGNRTAIINPKAQNAIVKGNKSLFQDATEIAKQYKKGIMGEAAGATFRMAQNIYIHTVGPQGGTPLVDGSGTVTGSVLTMKGWTATAALRLKRGDVFTIANVYSVNPITFQSTGTLQNFVLTSDMNSDGSGNSSASIYPSIIVAGNTQTVNSTPVDGAAITVLGAANTVTPLNMVYHKDAFILGTADLMVPQKVEMGSVARDEESGLSIRFIRFYDGINDKMVNRLDILFGWLLAHPEWACRVQG